MGCIDLVEHRWVLKEARRQGDEAVRRLPLPWKRWGGGLKTEPFFRLDQTPGLITELPHATEVFRSILHTHTHTHTHSDSQNNTHSDTFIVAVRITHLVVVSQHTHTHR